MIFFIFERVFVGETSLDALQSSLLLSFDGCSSLAQRN